MRIATTQLLACLLACAGPAVAGAGDAGTVLASGHVFADANGNGRRDPGERGIAGAALSNGRDLVRSGADGGYRLALAPGQTLFVVKPPGWDITHGDNGLPRFWFNYQPQPGPVLHYRGLAVSGPLPAAIDFPLRRAPAAGTDLEVLLFTDPQPKSRIDVDYYRRDIVAPLIGRTHARLGLTLGDVVADDLSLYPAMNAVTASLGVPWLHVPGNHDIDFDAAGDAGSLDSFRNAFGPDTFAWETRQATFIGLDDVIYRPGMKPAYVGGLREDQFAFLQAYLPMLPRDRLLVLALHIPLFDAEPGMETFRHADRSRLFALLRDFPHVLVVSGHSHAQRHWYHGADEGWQGATPLHEYNVGAACGSYWSGVKDADGIPDSRMNDGTPNGHATLTVRAHGDYALAWHNARDPVDSQLGLHAPRVLRQGAYPAWGVYANVYMGDDATRVEYRIDGGQWQAMQHVLQPDPRLLVENMRDDLATRLRGYDRSPEAVPSPHVWRGALPTDLALGEHAIEVRASGRWLGVARATTRYRLDAAVP